MRKHLLRFTHVLDELLMINRVGQVGDAIQWNPLVIIMFGGEAHSAACHNSTKDHDFLMNPFRKERVHLKEDPAPKPRLLVDLAKRRVLWEFFIVHKSAGHLPLTDMVRVWAPGAFEQQKLPFLYDKNAHLLTLARSEHYHIAPKK